MRHVGRNALDRHAWIILNMAKAKAIEEGYPEEHLGHEAIVLQRLEQLEQRYGGWMLHDDGYYYKDFEQPGELTDMLIFIRQLGLHWNQLDHNALATSEHLRMSPHNYNLIFNPSALPSQDIAARAV